jgi:hypothetical protein
MIYAALYFAIGFIVAITLIWTAGVDDLFAPLLYLLLLTVAWPAALLAALLAALIPTIKKINRGVIWITPEARAVRKTASPSYESGQLALAQKGGELSPPARGAIKN